MNLFRLPLSPVSARDGLPRAVGPAEAVTRGAGLWHVHGGAWSRDGKSLFYTRDTDRGDIYSIEGFGPRGASARRLSSRNGGGTE